MTSNPEESSYIHEIREKKELGPWSSPEYSRQLNEFSFGTVRNVDASNLHFGSPVPAGLAPILRSKQKKLLIKGVDIQVKRITSYLDALCKASNPVSLRPSIFNCFSILT